MHLHFILLCNACMTLTFTSLRDLLRLGEALAVLVLDSNLHLLIITTALLTLANTRLSLSRGSPTVYDLESSLLVNLQDRTLSCSENDFKDLGLGGSDHLWLESGDEELRLAGQFVD